jgi:catechol 2,3-dioxygenase-like lactoylglutathione lyase family enzyme
MGQALAAADRMSAMLRDGVPVAFVASTDLSRSRAFYEGVLGLSLAASDDIALAFDLRGTSLRVARVDQFQPQPFTVLGWQVDDVQAAVRALAAHGVRFERHPPLEQDDLGIWVAPSGARIAWFQDPDGNVLSIAQY